ncbi:MAG: hypothetical protein IPH38_18490 [Candidatus Microthrix sp.]|nr:hypothetical protein [Candidatus Microthrix sp.]MBK7021523.1 hypothetical protein [Candidatus Microthrix sp.]
MDLTWSSLHHPGDAADSADASTEPSAWSVVDIPASAARRAALVRSALDDIDIGTVRWSGSPDLVDFTERTEQLDETDLAVPPWRGFDDVADTVPASAGRGVR